MNKLLLFFGICIFISLSSCKKDDDVTPDPIEEVEQPDMIFTPEEIVIPDGVDFRVTNQGDFNEEVILSPDQIVVRFDEDTSEERRNQLREEFLVTVTEKCDCDNSNLEIWTINTDLLDIETALDNLESKEEEEGVEGDRQFTFSVSKPVYPLDHTIEEFYPFNFANLDDLTNSNDNTVNIAIIDTGIDFPRFNGVSTGFLYDNKDANVCKPTDFGTHRLGWNFIGSPGNIEDLNGHGTYVTRMITSELEDKEVDYKILPLKAFDDSGKGSYWNILCAVNFVKNYPDVRIVNASFGGQLNEKNTKVLKDVIQDLGINHNILVVTSAGNKGENTDTGEPHLPSGYDLDNILSVGGYLLDKENKIAVFSDNRITGVSRHPDSNYGSTSIDVLAPFQDNYISFEGVLEKLNDEIIQLVGTSYSAAFITAKCSILYSDNPNASPRQIKEMLLKDAFYSEDLKDQIKDGKVILNDNFVTNTGN